MIEVEESETLQMLRSSVREFALKEIMPVAAKMDEEDYFPADIFKKMGKLGYLGITIPERYGGSGMGYAAQAVIQEEIGYASASLALSYGAHSNLCLDNLYRNGSEEIREKYVPKLCSGEFIGSLCLTEPSSGSDALAMKTRAERNGNGFVINGSKTYITNAPYADLLLVYARTGDAYTPFILLAGDKGVSRGNKFSKMGMRGSPTGELYFDSVDVGMERIVGELDKGLNVILSGLNSERVILSYIFLGIAKRALELSLKYSTERSQFGEQLYNFELIQEKLAYMYTRYRTSRMIVDRALRSLEKDRMNLLDSASAILYAAESAEFISREAIQIHGGLGYMKNAEVERLLRDAILGQIGAGTTEIRKKLVARELVKQYKKNNNFLNENDMY